MEKYGLCFLGLYACCAALLPVHCDVTKTIEYKTGKHFRIPNTKPPRRFHLFKKLDTHLDSSNTDPYVSSPFSMAPDESLPPLSLPENGPPHCVNPPSTPQPQPTIPSPMGYTTPSPLPASLEPILAGPTPIPPSSPSPPNDVPTPSQPVFSPPYYEPSPPGSEPNPTYYIPPSSGSVSSPRFLPPVVYPPPILPQPTRQVPSTALWCVAKASVPDPIIQEAMNYACGSGADCDQLQPSGSCFQPNTLFAHASYAFNSYWQRTKVTGGTCDFGGTSVLVTVDPSYDGCQFVYF